MNTLNKQLNFKDKCSNNEKIQYCLADIVGANKN